MNDKRKIEYAIERRARVNAAHKLRNLPPASELLAICGTAAGAIRRIIRACPELKAQ